MQTPVSTIMTRGKDSINNDVARLKGARFVATIETEEGSRFNESEVKLITGSIQLLSCAGPEHIRGHIDRYESAKYLNDILNIIASSIDSDD